MPVSALIIPPPPRKLGRVSLACLRVRAVRLPRGALHSKNSPRNEVGMEFLVKLGWQRNLTNISFDSINNGNLHCHLPCFEVKLAYSTVGACVGSMVFGFLEGTRRKSRPGSPWTEPFTTTKWLFKTP